MQAQTLPSYSHYPSVTVCLKALPLNSSSSSPIASSSPGTSKPNLRYQDRAEKLSTTPSHTTGQKQVTVSPLKGFKSLNFTESVSHLAGMSDPNYCVCNNLLFTWLLTASSPLKIFSFSAGKRHATSTLVTAGVAIRAAPQKQQKYLLHTTLDTISSDPQ